MNTKLTKLKEIIKIIGCYYFYGLSISRNCDGIMFNL